MDSSRISNYFLLILLSALMGCSTSHYRVLQQDKSGAELSVTPDRILLECEYIADADEPGLYGFMIHVLDEKNTVVTFAQSNTLDQEGCEDRFDNIQKILKSGTEIYIASRGNLNDPKGTYKSVYNFPNIGRIEGSSRSMEFVAISNENGLCYGAHHGFQVQPCPPEPFPFWNKK